MVGTNNPIQPAKPKSTWSEYRSHPIFIIGSTVAAMLLFSISVLVPIFTARLANQVSELSAKVGQLHQAQQPLKDSVEQYKQALQKATKDLNAAHVQMRVMELKNSFSGPDPFPAGWQEVHIGDTQAALDGAFKTIDRSEPGFWVVKADNGALFSEAAYYFKSRHPSPTRQVVSVLLLLKTISGSADESRQIIIKQLTARYGTPADSVDPDTAEHKLIWNADSLKLMVDALGFHIDATCATGKFLKSRGVKFDSANLPCP